MSHKSNRKITWRGSLFVFIQNVFLDFSLYPLNQAESCSEALFCFIYLVVVSCTKYQNFWFSPIQFLVRPLYPAGSFCKSTKEENRTHHRFTNDDFSTELLMFLRFQKTYALSKAYWLPENVNKVEFANLPYLFLIRFEQHTTDNVRRLNLKQIFLWKILINEKVNVKNEWMNEWMNRIFGQAKE